VTTTTCCGPWRRCTGDDDNDDDNDDNDDDDDDDLLRAVAALYRRAKRLDRRRTMSFADGRSPLQVGHVYRYCQLHDDTFVGPAFSDKL